ncbi:MAG: division/cell wall cluster transcriptional repressor MraZ [Victivallales bacterium]|nr:division/cell wall cluster transcriptional repressor MraZ [Victivallales bacterium]
MSEAIVKKRRVFTATISAMVDGQRRVTMPKIWRLPTDTPDTEFYLIPGRGRRIMILTEEKMNAVYDNVEDICFADGEKIVSLEDIASRIQRVTLDKQGRFALNPDLAEFSGITDQAVFKGAIAYGTLMSPASANTESPAPSNSSFDKFVELEAEHRNQKRGERS